MSYLPAALVAPVPFGYPRGLDNTQLNQFVRGNLSLENGSYISGGIGSSAFQVTAVSSAGVVTFSTGKGCPLRNGQTVVLTLTAHNNGTYTISNVTYTAGSTTAGTFTINATVTNAETGLTATGVGQLQFAERFNYAQTFFVSSYVAAGGFPAQWTLTYNSLTGPQIYQGNKVVFAGFSNAGNNGSFTVVSVKRTSVSTGTFVITNPLGVATDSGNATGLLTGGIEAITCTGAPTEVQSFSVSGSGYLYGFNAANQTLQLFDQVGNGGSPAADAEYTNGGVLPLDVVQFVSVFPREATI